jgi:hypothetical protein
MSSSADITSGGADYMFTRARETFGAQLSNNLIFDARRMFTRMDWFSQASDTFGQHSPNLDIINKTVSTGSAETMWKHRIDLDDAVGFLVYSESHRKNLIKEIKAEGITHFGSRTVEEFIIAPETAGTAPTSSAPPLQAVPLASLAGGPVA